MKISLKRRIWLTVAVIVLFFTILVLYIVPSQQEKYFIKNFNQEVENLARTVALGVKIALTEQNFEGVQTAMDFAKSDTRLNFVAMVSVDTVWSDDGSYEINRQIINIYPENIHVDGDISSSDSMIVKHAPFDTEVMSGEIMAGFNTGEIKENMNQIRMVAIIVSLVVFLFGILLGLWLARTISRPVLAIRDAAIRVGQGDLSQKVSSQSKDEIGELTHAFNKMVDDLSDAEEKIREKNQALMHTLGDLEEKNEQLSIEKRRSDELLLNILPKDTADELKLYGKAKAKLHDNITVLFADIKDFTQTAEQLTPEQLVEELDFCFSGLDHIIGEYDIEKIKTVGDAYICAAGFHEGQNRAEDIVMAALEMQEFLQKTALERKRDSRIFFNMRIGIHTGPVVAGVVGSKKFAYDIWGDTVNLAARMEQNSLPGKINISKDTYKLVKNKFNCISRGKVDAKHKGLIEMYFVNESIQDQKIPTT